MISIASFTKKDDLHDAVAYMKTLSVPSDYVSLGAGHHLYTSICVTASTARAPARPRPG